MLFFLEGDEDEMVRVDDFLFVCGRRAWQGGVRYVLVEAAAGGDKVKMQVKVGETCV